MNVEQWKKKQLFLKALQFNWSRGLPLLPRWLPISKIYLIRMNSCCPDCCALQVSSPAKKCPFFLNSAVLSNSTNDLHGNHSYPKKRNKTAEPLHHSNCKSLILHSVVGSTVIGGFEGSDLIDFLFQSFYLFIPLGLYAVVPNLLFNLI